MSISAPDESPVIRVLIIVSFIAAFIASYPAWLRTTSLYQAPIPAGEIVDWKQSTQNESITFYFDFALHLDRRWSTAIDNIDSLIHELQLSCSNTIQKVIENVVTLNSERYTSFPVDMKAKFSLDWVDNWMTGKTNDLLHVSANDSVYHVYVLDQTACDQLQDNNNSWDIQIGSNRALLICPRVTFTHDQFSRVINAILSTIMGQELSEISILLSKDKSHADSDAMRLFQYSPEFHVSFDILNGASDELIVDWDIDKAVKEYFLPAFKHLNWVSKFRYHSRVQEYASLSIATDYNSIERRFEVPFDRIPHLFNVGEWNLDSPVSNFTEIHFVLYIPGKNNSPLTVLNQQGMLNDVNAVLMPRWGGVAIYNTQDQHNSTAVQRLHLSSVDLKTAFEAFAEQFRRLIGIEPVWPSNQLSTMIQQKYDVKVFQSTCRSGMSLWETDKLLRRRVSENLISGTETLLALVRMLDSLPNMRVGDHIKDLSGRSLDLLKKSHDYLKQKNLGSAFLLSKEASSLANKAFFDPTMTAVLYFPDEHLYAVYAPLFFPIGVPVVMSILRELRRRF